MSKATLRSTTLLAQRAWADRAGLSPDDRGYLTEIGANLWRPMSHTTRISFDAGDGGELRDRDDGTPAKMRALISSSALAVNVFDHWTERDLLPLLRALEVEGTADDLRFEDKLSTGAKGNAPNLDVVIRLGDGSLVGVESKFSEWMTPSSKMAESLTPYFDGEGSYWSRAGLPLAHAVAKAMLSGEVTYRFLNVPQLLKHALGLHRQTPASWHLRYLYVDGVGPDAAEHAREVARFEEALGAELRFRAISYQSLISRLASSDCGEGYLEYLQARYFAAPIL